MKNDIHIHTASDSLAELSIKREGNKLYELTPQLCYYIVNSNEFAVKESFSETDRLVQLEQ